MRLNLPRPTLPTLKRFAQRALLVTASYAFCGFLLLPLLARPILKSQLQQILHRQVSLAKVAINPFTLSLGINKLVIADLLPGRPLFICDALFVNLELLSLVKLGPVLKEVTLSGPAFSVIRSKGRAFNFSDLLPQGSEAEVPEKPAAPPRFSIGALAIHQGRIAFSDLTVHQEQVVEGLEVQVPFLSSMAADQERVVKPQVNARVNGAPLTLSGELTPFAPKATNSFTFSVSNAQLASLAPYLPKEWGLSLVSGWADMELNLSLSGAPALAGAMTASGRLALTAVDLAEASGAPLLTLPSLTVTMAPSAILKRELHLSGVALGQPVVTLQRNADRTTNLAFLAPPQRESASLSPAAEVEPALQLSVDEVVVSGARIALTDLAVAAPFHTVLAPVDLTLSGLFTKGEGGADYTITLASEAGETLSMEGSATLSPWRSEGELTLTGLSLPKYRPYWAEFVNFTLDSASMDLDTGFQLDPSGPRPGLALNDLGLTLRDLSLGRGEEHPLVTIPVLSLEQGRLDLTGRTLSLGKINSQGGYVVGQRLADGAIDLGSLLRPGPVERTQETAPPPWAIEVKAFAFTDYAVQLRDAAHPAPLALDIGQLAIHGQGLRLGEVGVTLGELGCELAALSLGRAQAEPFLTIPSLAVAGVAVDQPGRAARIERLTTHGGQLACARQKEGSMDLATLLAPRVVANTAAKHSAPSPAWDLTLGQLGLSDFRVAFTDQTLAHPLDLDFGAITLTARELSTRGSGKATVEGEFALADHGHLAFSGQLGHDPLAVDLGLKAQGIPVATFEPYWGERLKMRVSTGEFAVDGRLSMVAPPEKPLAIRYQGGASLVDFLALDRARQKLLAWKSLTTDGLDLAVSPLRLTIDNVGLTDYFLSLVLSPEGRLNLRELLVEKGSEGTLPSMEQPPSALPAHGEEPRIAISRVTLQGGEIDFSDRHIRPNFTTKLLAMTGRISGLASAQESRAEVDLFGKLANRAPITITGTMNPLAPELFVDLKGSMKDVELSSLTPYAGRYVGYTIRKGKLYLDTSYSIVGTHIDSQHSFLLDQFLLGDQVESREAIKAPIKLAVALLKDRKGEIHFELPIKGDLGRPDFRIGDIAAKIFMGLLTKAVTAPFALLGALFGGEELRMVEFARGSVALLPESQKRLDALAKALHDRPGLTLEIKGYAAQDQDHEALARQRYAQLLLAGEEGGQVAMEEGARLVAAMTPKEMEKRLTRAYKQADFPKPRNILGFTKGLEPEEMKKLLLSHIEVSGDDLLLLADERAQVVTAYLQGASGVEAKRLSRLEPGVEPARGEGKVSGSRVDFSLR